MRLRDFDDLKNINYTPKMAVAYICVTINLNKNKLNNVDVMMEKLKSIIYLINNKTILDVIDSECYRDIGKYWGLSIYELVGYAYVIFNRFKDIDNELSYKFISDSFEDITNLHSPRNVIEIMEKRLTNEETVKQ